MVVGAVVTLPVLIGLGAAWKAKSDVAGLYENQRALELENANFRQATAALSGQIESLQSAIADLGARSALEPGLAKAMANLPAFVKAKAMGGGTPRARRRSTRRTPPRSRRSPAPTTRSACCARCSKGSSRGSRS